jgi:hypothetical protein
VLETDRLKEFSDSVEGTLRGVEMQFGSVDTLSATQRTTPGEAVTAAVSHLHRLGGIWSGYRIAASRARRPAGRPAWSPPLAWARSSR